METYPIMYTSEEGGEWKLWTFGPIDPHKELLIDVFNPIREVNGVKVHSFILPIRWDCFNGFEHELYDAEIPFTLASTPV